MRRLDRYVMGEFVRMLILSLISLTAIFVLVHLMDHIDLYLDEGAPWAAIGKYYLYQTPYNLLLTMPMAMLVATILALGELGRHGELTAMKASGISLYRVVAPILAFALLLSLGVLALGETLVPRLNERVNEVYEEEIRGEPPGRENFRGSFVYQNDDGYTYIVRSLFVEEGVLPDSLAPASPEEARARQAAELAERRRAAGLAVEAAPDSAPASSEPVERDSDRFRRRTPPGRRAGGRAGVGADDAADGDVHRRTAQSRRARSRTRSRPRICAWRCSAIGRSSNGC